MKGKDPDAHRSEVNLPSAGLKQTAPPLKPGSAQGFFLLVREFFLATTRIRNQESQNHK